MTITHDNALHGHTDEDSAYLVEDYPYGFRLRTSIRYWIETTKHGDRFVSQTLNPKTGRWNKPKRSTYCPVGCMYVDELGHVTWAGLREWAEDDDLELFVSIMAGHLNAQQKEQIAQLKGLKRAYEGVTFSVHEGAMTDEDKAEQAQIQRHINGRVRYETAAARHEYPS